MKNIKKIVITFLAVFSVFVLASCNDKKTQNVEFLRNSISMQVGQKQDLNDTAVFKTKNVNLRQVEFSSTNASVAFVSDEYKITAISDGITTIKAKIGRVETNIIVNVLKADESFESVSSLVFEPSWGVFSWNPAYLINANGNYILASEYKINVTKDNEEYTDYTKITNTSYSVFEAGTYTVSVFAKSEGYNWSEEKSIAFTVLPQITNLTFEKSQINTNSHRISWDTVEGVNEYEVKVNNNEHVVNSNSYDLTINKAGNYDISVRAISGDNSSVYTDLLTVTKLATPVFKIDNGVLKVEPTQAQKVENYFIRAKNYEDQNQQRDFLSSTGIFDLEKLPAGNYIVNAKAIANEDNNLIISSDETQATQIEKLANPSIEFDKQTKTITVRGGLEKSNVFIKDVLSGQVKQVPIIGNENSILFTENFGEYEIWAQNTASQEQTNKINSDASSTVFVKALSFPIDLTHNVLDVDGQNKSFISFQSVIGADSYEFSINSQVVQAREYEVENNRLTFVFDLNTDELFAQSGEYEIVVNALNTDFESGGANYYLVYTKQQNNRVVVTRLSSPEQIIVATPSNSAPITWQAVEGALSYNYIIFKNNQLFNSGNFKSNSLDVADFEHGNYELTIICVGDNEEYLTSLNQTTQGFNIVKKLLSPTLSFDRGSQEEQEQNIVITPPENADVFEIYYEENLILEADLIEDAEGNLNFDISSYLQVSGQHTFEVIAKSKDDDYENGGNLQQSDKASISIIKLSAVENVIFEDEKTFKINDVLIDALVANEFEFQIKINHEQVDINQVDFSLLQSFELSITKIANQDLTMPYYVSSDEFVVTYNRLSTPQNLSFENWNVSWDEVAGSLEYEVRFVAQELEYTTFSDIASIDTTLLEFYENLESGFSFTVKAVAAQEYIIHNQTLNFSSFVSEDKAVEPLLAPEILSVEKQDENIYMITWEIVDNAQSYMVNFEGQGFTEIENQIVITVDEFEEAQLFEVWALSPNYINSAKSYINFEKISLINQVDVQENQTFKISNLPEFYKDISINGNIVLPEEEIEILNIETLQGEEYVYNVQALGEYRNENSYYLSSQTSVFKFKKYATPQNLRIENNSIMWDVQPDAKNYELIISKQVGEENHELKMLIPARQGAVYVNSVLLDDIRISDFIEGFDGQVDFTLSIKVKISDYILENSQVGYIDSEANSQAQLQRLLEVENLSVDFEGFDLEQTALTLSWDSVLDAEFYNVFVNGSLMFENQTTTHITTDKFAFEKSLVENAKPTGEFQVNVIAYASNKLPSKNSQTLSFIRLDKVKNFITVNDEGLLQWDKNSISQSYLIYLETQDGVKSESFIVEDVVQYDVSSFLQTNELFEQGTIIFNIIVLGSNDNEFASALEKIEQIRLDKPVFEISGQEITISQSNINPEATFQAKVYFQAKDSELKVELTTLNLQSGENTLPETWHFKDGEEVTQEGRLIFEVVTIKSDFITSIKTTKEIIKLQPIMIEGIKKSVDINGNHLFTLLTFVNNVTQEQDGDNSMLELVIRIESDVNQEPYEFIDSNVSNRQGQIAYDNNEMFYAMDGNFKIYVKISGIGYLDSKFVSISGTRLKQNDFLGSVNGVLTWERTTQRFSTGYLLNVHHGVIDDEIPTNSMFKHITDLSTITDTLKGIAGQTTANVKVLGNMPIDEVVSTNIVLDSFFMGEISVLEDGSLIFDDNSYTATKLFGAQDVTISQGMFSINKTDEPGLYTIVALDGEHEGHEYEFVPELENQDVFKGLGLGFYQGSYALQVGKTYTFGIKSLSTSQDILNSDVIGEIKIKVLDPISSLNVSWKEEGLGMRMDKVSITWNQVQNAQGYIIVINGKSVIQGNLNIVDTNEYILQSNNALSNKNHNLQVRAMGSSVADVDGVFTLTSKLSSTLQLRGLATPNVELIDGVLSWNNIQGAEGYYIYYMREDAYDGDVDKYIFSQYKTWHWELITKTHWQMPESFSDDTNNSVYYFAVVAINTDINHQFMPSAYGTIFEEIIDPETEEILRDDLFCPLTVLKAPDLFTNKDGTIIWTGNYNYSLFEIIEGKIKGGTSPFVYEKEIQKLFDLYIRVKVRAENSFTFTKDFEAVSLFYASIFDMQLFRDNAEAFGFDLDQRFGISHIDEFINEVFPDVRAGNNNISALQIGNSESWINSKYNTGKNFYVPAQVHATINNGILSWNDVDLPTQTIPYGASNKYTIVSENELGERIVLAQTNDLSIDLMDFVNNDTLTPGTQKIYVVVSGDNGRYTNGIANAPVVTFVLPSVNARMEGGILYWDSMQQTDKYLVSALTEGEYDSFTSTMTDRYWEFKQLNARDANNNRIEYELSLQALGNGKSVLSGKVTEFGTVFKLDTPLVSVENSIFVWINTQDNFGYEISVYDENSELETMALNKDVTQYESQFRGFNRYNFRSYGSTTSALEVGSINYAISSYLSNDIYAVLLNSVQNAKVENGKIIWQRVGDLSSVAVENYKLSFDQSNFYSPAYLTIDDITTQVIDSRTYVIYELPQDYNPGLFKIYIQAMSDKTFAYNGNNYKYLLGEIEDNQSVVEFEKLQKAINARVIDGEIIWEDPNTLENTYKITFTQGSNSFDFITTTPNFNPTTLRGEEQERYELITHGQTINIKVQILGNNTDLINSDILTIGNFDKLKTLVDFEYVTDDESQNGFMIRWYLPEEYVPASNYEYVIVYSSDSPDAEEFVLSSLNDPSGYIKKGFNAETERYYAEIEMSILMGAGFEKLKYRVAIIPVTASATIPSNFSDKDRSFTLPLSLNGVFVFNKQAQEIAWNYEEAGTENDFRIVDELVSVDENGVVSVIKTNIYTSREKTFYPKETGLHRIKIAVVMRSGNVSSAYVYFYHQETMEGLINNENFVKETPHGQERFTLMNFDLFESGDGTSENAYKISTQTHFENISYRLQKPTYLSGEEVFYFAQTQNLIFANLTQQISDFAGVYDGQDNTIDYTLTSSLKTSNQDVALFRSLSKKGVIKNIAIKSKIILQNAPLINSVSLSALVVVNNGTIENVLIKTFEFESRISTSSTRYTYGSVANQNESDGKIIKAKNQANLEIGKTGEANILNADITVGGIVNINKGLLYEVGSTGNIKVTAKKVNIAGLAVFSQKADGAQNNATINRGFNTGILEAIYTASNGSLTSYVAGLVGRNSGEIFSSYNSSLKLSVNLNNTNNIIHVGGLVGNETANGGLISNSFTTTEIERQNYSSGTVQAGLLIGINSAAQHPGQLTSYYMAKQGFYAMNGTGVLRHESFSDYQYLFEKINSQDIGAFSFVNGKVQLNWESQFDLI